MTFKKSFETSFSIFESEYSHLRNKNKKQLSKIIEDHNEIKNMIIYGPENSGKYVFALDILRNFSNQNLKYYKKTEITINKVNYIFMMSDIHFEIDMNLLGTSFKQIWYDFYDHICNIIQCRSNKKGYILVKNFQDIPDELLNQLYSFMQNKMIKNINISFIFISREISFIPKNIREICILFTCPIKKIKKNKKKYLFTKEHEQCSDDLFNYCNETFYNILKNNSTISNSSTSTYNDLRVKIYNLFIRNYNIHYCISYIIQKYFIEYNIKKDKISLFMYNFCNEMKYYNNNYRPIYHIEHLLLNLCNYI